MQCVKLVIVGDDGVGKTSLLMRYTSGEMPATQPKVFDNYSQETVVDGRKVSLGLWDTAGSSDYDRLRPLSYPRTDVFLIAFSLADAASFDNAAAKWRPEIWHHMPSSSVVYVGLKRDKAAPSLADKARRLAEQTPGAKYVQCSALTGDGVDEVFVEAIRSVFSPRRARSQRSCRLL